MASSADRSIFKPSSWILLLLLLLPSLAQVWQQSDVPRLGDFHDDSIYWVTAKSLGTGSGYHIQSLPGEPYQTKYPPLYPLLLSLAWRIDPAFPHNLPLAAWISWLSLPAVVFQLLPLFRRMGFSPGRTWLLLGLFAVNPYVALFSTQFLSEMLFLALVLAAMLLVERSVDVETSSKSSAALSFAAGIAGGLAAFTRSAGTVLLLAAVIYLCAKKQRRNALLFAAAMLPFVLGWTLWSRIHHVPTNDPSLIYYTDYFRNQVYSLALSDLHVYVWKNLDGLLWGLGGLIVPNVTSSWFMKILAQVMAVAMISGVVRMVRRGQAQLYGLYAAIAAVLLVVCSFPANERLVLPLFPLALAGLLVEMEHVFDLSRAGLRHRDRSQRVAALGFMTVIATLLAGALALQLYVGQVFMPQDAQNHRVQKATRIQTYEWAKANLPQDATVLSTQDVIFYLYTGRHAMSAVLPTRYWYREDRTNIVNWFTELQPFARDHGLSYFEFYGADPNEGVDAEAAAAIEHGIRTSPELSPLHATPEATLYAFR